MEIIVYLAGEIHTNWREEIKKSAAEKNLPLRFVSPQTDHDASDGIGEEYRQWNTAMDASAAVSTGKPLLIIRPESLIHPLKELSNKANVTVDTVEQAVQVLEYVFKE